MRFVVLRINGGLSVAQNLRASPFVRTPSLSMIVRSSVGLNSKLLIPVSGVRALLSAR